MEIHNLMEELVLKTVQDLCDEEEKKSGSVYCTSEQCRVDVACFVLNRIPQCYVSSARGIAHSERAFKDNPQIMVDLVTLVHEGMKRVSHIQRPFYSTPEGGRMPQGPAFVFPTIKGRFLSCTTFEPVTEGAVSLIYGGELAAMIDHRWQNPYSLDPKIEGSFLFLPLPLAAGKAGLSKSFEFEISVAEGKYEAFHHFIKMDLVSEPEVDFVNRKGTDYKIADLYLVPR